MNILTVTYKNGEKRIIIVANDFFVPVPADKWDKKSGEIKKKILTYTDKVLDLAQDLGINPYKILLERNGEIAYERTNHANEPVKVEKKVQGVKTRMIDETKVKRSLFNEHKHIPLKTIFKASY